MQEIFEQIKLVSAKMEEKFPGMPYTVMIHIWQDFDYAVTCRHGDGTNIYNFRYQKSKDTITYKEEPCLSNAIKLDELGNEYYIPPHLIHLINE